MGYRKILVVEDDMTRRIVLEEIVKRIEILGNHYITDNVDDAKSYIDLNDDVDLVIMGWELPASIAYPIADAENGRELLRFVKSRNIKSIICSTRATELSKDTEFATTPTILPNPFDSLESRIKDYL